MIRVRLEYDGYNRIFKLVEPVFGSVFEDGAVYELTLPLLVDPEANHTLDAIEVGPLAHA